MKRNYFFALLISASMLFAACSESETDDLLDDSNNNTEEPAPDDNEEDQTTVAPTAISLSDSEKTMAVNDLYTLTATLTPSDAVGTITWTSSDEAVATVSSNGAVMALTVGTTNVVATCESLSATCVITVSGEVVEEPNEPEAEVDTNSIFLYAYGYGPEGSDTWTIIDAADNDGVYELTNSAIQANDYDTQFVIVFGSVVETGSEVSAASEDDTATDEDIATDDAEAEEEVVYEGIKAGYTYTVSMMVKQVGDLGGLWPGISSDIPEYYSDYLGAPEPNAWYTLTEEWGENTFTMTTDGYEGSDITGGNKISFSIGTSVTTFYVKDIKIYMEPTE